MTSYVTENEKRSPIPDSSPVTEPNRSVAPSAANDEVRRWYAVLKFCPLVKADQFDSRWNQLS